MQEIYTKLWCKLKNLLLILKSSRSNSKSKKKNLIKNFISERQNENRKFQRIEAEGVEKFKNKMMMLVKY